jgi:hypothetical protein
MCRQSRSNAGSNGKPVFLAYLRTSSEFKVVTKVNHPSLDPANLQVYIV